MLMSLFYVGLLGDGRSATKAAVEFPNCFVLWHVFERLLRRGAISLLLEADLLSLVFVALVYIVVCLVSTHVLSCVCWYFNQIIICDFLFHEFPKARHVGVSTLQVNIEYSSQFVRVMTYGMQCKLERAIIADCNKCRVSYKEEYVLELLFFHSPVLFTSKI
ncbi:hypothetical protein GQ457_04G006270 [Hibiscus cannabinus]